MRGHVQVEPDLLGDRLQPVMGLRSGHRLLGGGKGALENLAPKIVPEKRTG